MKNHIHDAKTGVTSIVDLTAEEIAQRKIDRDAELVRIKEREDAEAKKLSDAISGRNKLKSLGLTEDEIKSLVG